MAIYKTTSSKTIVRKIMRDINPVGDNWIDDAIEWIGEALEHIGASTQLEKKTCIVTIKDYKALLPNDLYYINQVAINTSQNEASLGNQIDIIKDQLNDILSGGANASSQLNQVNARLHVLQEQYLATAETSILSYCGTNFPRSIHCENCVNENAVNVECYYIDTDYIKTSFAEGKICLSYMAFPVDEDCYPLVPDDISYKEAMFWYVYKKMLLGRGELAQNGIDYVFADQQWKYYCTQARNAAVFPDIDRYESFMNQWVRLIPNINRHDEGFANLGTRENLNREDYAYMTTATGLNSKTAQVQSTPSTEPTPTIVYWTQNIEVNGITVADSAVVIPFPATSDVNLNIGSYPAQLSGDGLEVSNLNANTHIELNLELAYTAAGAGGIVVQIYLDDIQMDDVVSTVTNESSTLNLNADIYAGDNLGGVITVKAQSTSTLLTDVKLISGNIRIEN